MFLRFALGSNVLREFSEHSCAQLHRVFRVEGNPCHPGDRIAPQRRQSLNDVGAPRCRPPLRSPGLDPPPAMSQCLFCATLAIRYQGGAVGRACLDRFVRLARARVGSECASHHKSLLIDNGNVARPRRLRKDIGRYSVGRRQSATRDVASCPACRTFETANHQALRPSMPGRSDRFDHLAG